MNTKTEEILKELNKIIVGKEAVLEKTLMAILSRGHILLDDVPGVGKTTLALACSKVLGLDYHRIQFTPDVVPSDIIGFSMYNKESGTFEYKPGVVMTNLLLADEINRTSSKTQSALLEVMEEGQVTVDGETHELPKPFVVLATQNPVGSAGTQLLPQAQLDRFMIRMEMGYPDFQSQVNILRDRQTENPLDKAEQVTSTDEILEMQDEVTQIYIEDKILEYVTSLAMNTREGDDSLRSQSSRCTCGDQTCQGKSLCTGKRLCYPGRCAESLFGRLCASYHFKSKGKNCSTFGFRCLNRSFKADKIAG